MVKPLYERYGLVPMERSFHLITPTRHVPARSIKRFCTILERGEVIIYHEKPEDYYHRGFVILAADGGFKSFALYCQVEAQPVSDIENILARALFGVYGWDVTL